MKPVLLLLPEPWIKKVDDLVRNTKRYPNRAEALRFAVRDFINSETFEKSSIAASLTKICIAWNQRELESKEAMWEIWRLFEKEVLGEREE